MARLHDQNEPVYIISVAARLLGVSMQTLRQYEANDLVQPARSDRGTRLYSENDLLRLKHIIHLSVRQCINMAGVREILKRDDAMKEKS